MGKLRETIFGVVLGASLCLNAIVVYHYLSGSEPKVAAAASGVALPAEGSSLPRLRLQTKEGSVRTVDYANDPRPTVLYVISPTCRWCQRNTPNMQSLAQQVSSKYRFVGISISGDGLDEYLAAHPLGFAVEGIVSPADLEPFGYAGTPYTIVVSPEGQVLGRWRGGYGGSIERSIARFFGVKLPGMNPT